MAVNIRKRRVEFSDLPGWVKAHAMNDPAKFRGAVWFSTGRGSYVARQPGGALIDVVVAP